MRPHLALLACLPLAAGALEIDDLRLGGGYTWQRWHSDSDATITVAGVPGDFSNRDSGDDDRHWRIALEGMRSLRDVAGAGAPILGASLRFEHGEVAAADRSFAERSDGFALDLLPGWAVPLGDALHLEACGVAGAVWQREAIHVGSAAVSGQDSDGAVGWEAGARVALVWTAPERWQVGLVGEYLRGGIRHSFDVEDVAQASSFTADIDDRTDGFTAAAFVGWRL